MNGEERIFCQIADGGNIQVAHRGTVETLIESIEADKKDGLDKLKVEIEKLKKQAEDLKEFKTDEKNPTVESTLQYNERMARYYNTLVMLERNEKQIDVVKALDYSKMDILSLERVEIPAPATEEAVTEEPKSEEAVETPKEG